LFYPGNRKVKFISFFLVIAALPFFIDGCSGGRNASEKNSLLTAETAKSRSSGLKVKIPGGWFTALDNENNIIDLWLIKEDYSASLNFIALNIDEAALKESGGDEIAAAVKFSKAFRKSSAEDSFQSAGDDEYFKSGTENAGAYKYRNKSGSLIRVVVFRYQNKFYELSAVPSPKINLPQNAVEELFNIQNSVLSSVE